VRWRYSAFAGVPLPFLLFVRGSREGKKNKASRSRWEGF
jgi:hypothetical protein